MLLAAIPDYLAACGALGGLFIGIGVGVVLESWSRGHERPPVKELPQRDPRVW